MAIRVLIADPEPQLLDAYCRFLARLGFEVATAMSGPECLARLNEWVPDVLVLEPDMPDAGGEQALRELNRRSPRLPVFIVSRLEQKMDAYPVCEYYVKPCSLVQLADAIRAAVTPPPTFQPCS